MNIVFLGPYFNHHQKPMSDALAALADYTYIATSRMPAMRRELGYGMDAVPEYVFDCADDLRRAEARLREADVVITGSAPEHLVRACIRRGQLVLRYAERPLKQGPQWHKYLPRLLKWHVQNPAGKPVYMLCASAYTAGDYARFGLFRGRTYQWGYFPQVRRYEAMPPKAPGTILWAGRFLDWKHPDDALRAAARLKAEGIPFTLEFIGTGPMEAALADMIRTLDLSDRVRLLGAMKPEEVRAHMERAAVFLFTSGRQEGWGAVVNEAMNSGCALVASSAAGAPPYLIRHGENGLLFRCGDADGLYEQMKYLLTHPDRAEAMGRRAYETIIREWNAETAARRLVALAEALLAGERQVRRWDSGPCSPARIIREDGKT